MRLDDKVGWVETGLDVRADGAECIETLGAGELHIAFLKIPRGDVIEAGVAQNEGKRVVRVSQMRAAAAKNEGEFAFVFHLLRVFREHDRFLGTDEGGRRLEKHQRLFRDFVPQLCGMSGVIPADADDF